MYDIQYGRLYRLKKKTNSYPEYVYTVHMSSENRINDKAFDRIKVIYVSDYDKLTPTMYKWEIYRHYQLVEDA